MSILGPVSPFSHSDRFVVYRDDGKPIEGHLNKHRAEAAAEVLNAHNIAYCIPARYMVRPVS